MHFTAVYLTAVPLGSEYLNAVNLTQLKLATFNLTATDTNLQAKKTFNFVVSGGPVGRSVGPSVIDFLIFQKCHRFTNFSKKVKMSSRGLVVF